MRLGILYKSDERHPTVGCDGVILNNRIPITEETKFACLSVGDRLSFYLFAINEQGGFFAVGENPDGSGELRLAVEKVPAIVDKVEVI